MPHSVKSSRYIKYYSLSSIRGFDHSSNSVSSNCQEISSRTKSEANISENTVTKSVLKN